MEIQKAYCSIIALVTLLLDLIYSHVLRFRYGFKLSDFFSSNVCLYNRFRLQFVTYLAWKFIVALVWTVVSQYLPKFWEGVFFVVVVFWDFFLIDELSIPEIKKTLDSCLKFNKLRESMKKLLFINET